MGAIHGERQELVGMGRNNTQIDRLKCPSKQDAPNVEGRVAPNRRRVLLIERSQFAQVYVNPFTIKLNGSVTAQDLLHDTSSVFRMINPRANPDGH
jgi:hypothetical protein